MNFDFLCDMGIVVKIPNVDRDERIGSAFNHLFSVINQTENCEENVVIWDFSGDTFFHPFFLSPLVIYKHRTDKKIECINASSRLKSYFDLIHFDEPLRIGEDKDAESKLSMYREKTYTPVCKFDLCESNVDSLQTVFQNIIEHQSNADRSIKTPLSYLLSELVCNISQHSKSKCGYVFSQYLSKEKCIDVCIADDGITIYGSYIHANKYIDNIGDNEAEALKLANNGYSTKNLPNAENRGYGISTSKAMLVDGLEGSFFMLSGGAFHRYDTNGKVYVKLPDTIRWDGTIILMRIPVNAKENFDYIKYH